MKRLVSKDLECQASLIECQPLGTLYVSGSEVSWEQIVSVLDQVYPHELYTRHFSDGIVCYALDVPFPVGPDYSQLSALASFGVSGGWFPWNEVQPYYDLEEDEQWVF